METYKLSLTYIKLLFTSVCICRGQLELEQLLLETYKLSLTYIKLLISVCLCRGQLELEQLLLETYKLSLTYIKGLIELHTKAGRDIISLTSSIKGFFIIRAGVYICRK